ncbi:hypothetical protein M6G53_20395 [Serratia nevei]|uniref:hypothetical protein n=1 Tax=Serratia nevei TaxID=2703794 RepID=UPI0020A0D638|nr:hypothetical protein [Serratia nevei]MCP1107734.1 hypothetical protein [Serratia nevei]
MMEKEKRECFLLVWAFDRMIVFLKKKGVAFPDQKKVEKFLDLAWEALRDDSVSKVSTRSMERLFDARIVDEQDAGYEEIVVNMFLYALSNFCMYFEEGSASSLGVARNSILDFYDYIASQRYILNKKGGRAVVLTDADEEAIKNDPDFLGETVFQEADGIFAEKVVDWRLVERHQ